MFIAQFANIFFLLVYIRYAWLWKKVMTLINTCILTLLRNIHTLLTFVSSKNRFNSRLRFSLAAANRVPYFPGKFLRNGKFLRTVSMEGFNILFDQLTNSQSISESESFISPDNCGDKNTIIITSSCYYIMLTP